MSKAQFENLSGKLFRETIDCVEKVLVDAGISKEDIDEVVPVGGSTHIPKIQSMLSEFFNFKPLNRSLNPDEVVACGVAIQAAILNPDQHSSIRGCYVIISYEWSCFMTAP